MGFKTSVAFAECARWFLQVAIPVSTWVLPPFVRTDPLIQCRSPAAVPEWLLSVNVRCDVQRLFPFHWMTTLTAWSRQHFAAHLRQFVHFAGHLSVTLQVSMQCSLSLSVASRLRMIRLSSEAVLLTPRVSAVGEEVFCPGDHVSADWFHRLFNGMEWSAQRELADCVVCTAMTMESSIEIPCCRQLVNVICLARSFSSRGWIAFSATNLLQISPDLRRSWLLRSSMGAWSIFDRPPSRRRLNFLVLPNGFPRRWQFSVALASVLPVSSKN